MTIEGQCRKRLRYPPSTARRAAVALLFLACNNPTQQSQNTTSAPPKDTVLAGRYFLTAVNTVPVPSYGIQGDTLTLRPDSTYATIGAGPQASGFGTTGPDRYTIIAPDTLLLPVVTLGVTGGKLVRTGTTLMFDQPACCGNGEVLWRFDKEGSHPVLFGPPFLIANPTGAELSASSHGSLPAPVQIALTSSDTMQFKYFSIEGSSSSLNGYGASDWSILPSNPYATPGTLTVSVYNTALPPGQYGELLQVTAVYPKQTTILIPVHYTVTGP